MRVSFILGSLLALAACSGPEHKSAEQGEAAEPAKVAAQASDNAPYTAQLPIKPFMLQVMQHAGDGIWKRQGYRYDASGEHNLFPKNDADWTDAENSALLLAEFTNVLLTPPRRVPEKGWDDAVAEVRKIALQAATAAKKHEQAAWFEAGSQLDEACDSCHVKYDPTFKGS